MKARAKGTKALPWMIASAPVPPLKTIVDQAEDLAKKDEEIFQLRADLGAAKLREEESAKLSVQLQQQKEEVERAAKAKSDLNFVTIKQLHELLDREEKEHAKTRKSLHLLIEAFSRSLAPAGERVDS